MIKRPDDRYQHLPEVVDDESVQKIVELANQEDQRHAAETECDRALRRAVPRDPPHDHAACAEDDRLDDLDR